MDRTRRVVQQSSLPAPSAAFIVPLIDGLASRNLLEHAKAASDRRSHALRLTASGRRRLLDLLSALRVARGDVPEDADEPS